MASGSETGTDIATASYAESRDRADTLAPFRERFHRPSKQIYLDGNSLGLLSRDAETEVLAALGEWKRLAIAGWLDGEPPWFHLGETLGALMAPLIGAEPKAVVATGGTTINLHALAATFYRPSGGRRKIVATELDFPSDVYALASQIQQHGGDPTNDLVLVPAADGRTVDEEAVIAALTDEVAIAILPSVLYRSGQLLDIPRLAAVAADRGIGLGLDCAHSIGIVPHRFDEWGVDWAFWCSYKYLNGGPGAIGGLYVNRRHWGTAPALAGWWGYEKERQFDMHFDWRGAEGAGAWQIGTPSLLAAAPLRGSLRLFAEVGIAAIRAKSLALTGYLMDLIEDTGLTTPPFDFRIGTPRDTARRGGHVAVEHSEAARIVRALKGRGIIPDFRPPNIVRLAPVPLYTTFGDVLRVVASLREIIEQGEHRRGAPGRDIVA